MDDGYSGTSFDRPCFQKMLPGIEADRVSVCIAKDLSRPGKKPIGINKYAESMELTPNAANELIQAIYIGTPDKSSSKRRMETISAMT